MAEKGLYKKAVDSWDEDVKFAPRAKVNKMLEKNQSEKVGVRKKSTAKGSPRSNHKHEYKPVVIWRKSIFNDNIYGGIAYSCNICGKLDNDFSCLFGGRKAKKHLGELEHFWQNKQDELQPIDSKTYQKVVFIGGSKIINSLAPTTEEKIIDFMNLGHNILIGDSMGADLQIQKLLAESNYKKVTVYYSSDTLRVNLGGWQTKHISSNKFMSDYERQKLKDNQMANDCEYGYMLFKGITKGTMANIEELVKLNKNCEVVLTDYNGIYPYSFTVEDDKDVERIKWCYEKFDKR